MKSTFLAILVVLLAASAEAQSSRHGEPVKVIDCAQCPELVIVPPGSFTMGVAPTEEEREGVPKHYRGRSEPQTRVTIDQTLAMGKYEVTRREFDAFVRATGHQPGSLCFARRSDGEWTSQRGLSWRNPGFAQTDLDPVVCVTWEDAQLYVRWLRRITGKNYRLPSEAEWEYAARAGSQAARYWGNDPNDACRYANVADLTRAEALKLEKDSDDFFRCTDGYVFTAPVGRFARNAFGLHDMLGNAWEWVEDCWSVNLTGIPQNARARRDGDCTERVVRGGGWNFGPLGARATFREGEGLGLRGGHLGFRVARTRTE